ncbi:AgmX/PglI C-terminal domain-containing protein [Sandaracinus amylolyticus]|uniref:Putative abductin-like protein n=1 Tax=Sandaracinus amylolyticus TaxID=927083 RepID=A0A0F6YLZ0_9BACT|nr:AgmX/PglI C-terminal domain-containing protein [Sandaracinus amylolyticus]AKF08832.1 Putative abductin-like protein [Sandaracinus amylolyticus]
MAQASERRVQVVMSWGGNPQGEVSVKAGRCVVIGERAAHFLLPADAGIERFALVESDGTGGFLLRVPAGALLRASRDGADVSAEATSDATGARSIALDPAMRAEIELGAFTFFVQEGAPTIERTPMARPDFASWRWAGVSLAVHGAFLFSLLFSPPNAGALSLDLTHDQQRWVQVRLDAMAHEREEVIPEVALQDATRGAQSGQPSPGEEGAAGAPDETRSTGGGVRVRGDRQDQRVPLDRQSVTSAGALGTIAAFTRSMSAVSSPYGAADAMGFATDDAYGALMADQAGFSRGFGGLGMNGVGRGGGCLPGQPCGQGTIGVGGLGGMGFGTCGRETFERIESTQGHAAAVAQCAPGMAGGDVGIGRPGREGRPSAVPTLRCAPGPDGQCGQVAGGLSREQIRLVVTRNRGQVRHCYEQALQQRPDLAGRLSVAWTVHPEGRVTTAVVGNGSDLRNAEVEQCVLQAVRRWQFPATDGMTAVTYPFLFQTN